MADKKISALPTATTPLAGTEELPIVQGGSTVKVSVNNLTAGKAVTASQLTVENSTSNDAVRITQTGAGNALVVEDSANPDATPFVVDASGRVGVGKTPSSSLNILGNSNPAVDLDYYENGTGGASYRGRKGRGTASVPSAVQSNDYLSTLLASGYGDTGFGGNIGLIGFRANQTFTDTARGTNIVFENTPDGSNSRSERMRINSSGNVGIGTTSPSFELDTYKTKTGIVNIAVGNAVGAANDGARFNLHYGGTSIGSYGYTWDGGAFYNTLDFYSDLRFTQQGSEKVRIDSSGNVGIGTSAPNAAARLDVSSTTSGFLPPRMTTAQRDLIATPPNGLMLYNSTTDKLQVRAAGVWVDLH